MDIVLLRYFSQLGSTESILLLVAAFVLLYLFISNQVPVLMFLLVLSAALFTTELPIASQMASVARWFLVVLLLGAGLLFAKVKVSLGVLIFWGYLFFGFVSLLLPNNLMWQLQRGLLFVIVAAAIPIAYGDKPYGVYKSSLVAIALVSAIYSLINFSSLPTSLIDPSRYYGFAKGAPIFALVLGALLPFSFWAMLQADSPAIRVVCGTGLILGTITLLYSAQRAGTVAGILGLLPLFCVFVRQKRHIRTVLLLLGIAFLLGYFLYVRTSGARLLFLANRYSAEAGLSNRELIWQFALSHIMESPVLGRGFGATETIFSSSASSFHNSYLDVWYNTGILGLAFFLASQFYLFGRLVYLVGRFRDSETLSVVALSLGYLLGFVALSLFESIGAGASNVNVILYVFLAVLISNKDLFEHRPVIGWIDATASKAACEPPAVT